MPSRTLFADTFYWIALTSPRDAHLSAVLSFSRTLRAVRLLRQGSGFTEIVVWWLGRSKE